MPTPVRQGARVLVGVLAGAVAVLASVGPAPAASAASASPCRPVAGTRAVAPARPQAGANHATVVVDPGSGTVWAACIAFDGTINGRAALEKANGLIPNLNPVFDTYGGLGAALCQALGVGRTPPDCLSGGAEYWGYWQNGTYSRAGASSTTVRDGGTEGWRWGTGQAPRSPGAGTICQAPPPPTTAAPTTAAPTTAPPSGSGPGGSFGGTPGAGGMDGSAGTTAPGAPTTVPGASTSAPATTTSTAPPPKGGAGTGTGSKGDGSQVDDDPGGTDGRAGSSAGGSGSDERSVTIGTTPAASRRTGGGGGSAAASVAGVLAAAVVVIGLFAFVRHRRQAAAPDATG